MPRRVSPSGTKPVTMSLDKRVVEILDSLPSGDRSRRVNEILIANATLLGMDRVEQAELQKEYIRLKYLPMILKEVARTLDIVDKLSVRELKETLAGYTLKEESL